MLISCLLPAKHTTTPALVQTTWGHEDHPSMLVVGRELHEEHQLGHEKCYRAASGIHPRDQKQPHAIGPRTIVIFLGIYNDPDYMPTIPTLERIARVLGVATGDLLEDVPEPSEEA
jgi:hypothetical protein